MLLSFDRTNFPLIAMERMGVEVHLLPVTKWQFAQFVAGTDSLDEVRQQEMLALNPAIPPERVRLDEPEPLFISGILPEEALAFARWLGPGFDLPTVKEWRAIYASFRSTPLPKHGLSSELTAGLAGILLDRFSAHPRILSLLDFSLMRGGLVEWVRQRENLVGLGAPRPAFHANLWDPLAHEVRPIRLDERLPYFGFRLVRRGRWYLADKERVRYVY